MKLVSKYLELPINFSESNIFSLVISNTKLRTNFIIDLIESSKDNPHFIENEITWIDFAKEGFLYYDYFDFQQLSKRLNAKFVMNYLKSCILNGDDKSIIEEFINQIQERLIDFDDQTDLIIESPTIEKIIKTFDLDLINGDNIYDKVYSSVKNICVLSAFKILVFINPYFYLKKNEFDEILKLLSYSNISTLIILNDKEQPKYGKLVCIDDDFEEIR